MADDLNISVDTELEEREINVSLPEAQWLQIDSIANEVGDNIFNTIFSIGWSNFSEELSLAHRHENQRMLQISLYNKQGELHFTLKCVADNRTIIRDVLEKVFSFYNNPMTAEKITNDYYLLNPNTLEKLNSGIINKKVESLEGDNKSEIPIIPKGANIEGVL